MNPPLDCPQQPIGAKPASTAMSGSAYNEKMATIAVSLLKFKSPQIAQTLKNLLTFIPNPNHIKDILKEAVLDLVQSSPQVAFWLFQHPEVLEPEIQVREVIAEALANKLYSWGYTSDDFHFTADQNLIISDTVKATLLSDERSLIDGNEASLSLVRLLLLNSRSLP